MVTQEAPVVTPLYPLRQVVDSLHQAKASQGESILQMDPAQRQPLVQKVKEAGVAALPTLLRALTSKEGQEADWACYLLRELVGPETRGRVIKRLNALLVDAKLDDECKARVLGLLAELKAPIPEQVVLKDPEALLERSVRDLLYDLQSAQALTQALDLIFTQVPADEFENFLFEVVRLGGDAAQPLLASLLADARMPRPLAERLALFVRPSEPQKKPLEPQSLFPQPQRSLARPRMQRALRLLADGKLGLAHHELLALRAHRRDDPAVYSALGLCLLRLGKPAAALEQLEHAAELSPTVAAHAWNAAVAAHLTDQPDRLYRLLQNYLRSEDKRPGAAERRQAARALCGEFERLVACAYPEVPIERVLESEALFQDACAALSDARYTAAVDGFRAVLERLPTHPASWRNLGIAYLGERRPREAARCFSRVLRAVQSHGRVSSSRHLLRADFEKA